MNLKLINWYLNKIINFNYNFLININNYISQIQSAAFYLKELSYAILNPLLIYLVFKKLLSFFDNFTSRKYKELIKNIVNINILKLISKLILEETKIIFNIGGKINKTFKFRFIYRHCNKIKYLKFNYFIKHPKLINDFNFNKNKKGKFNKNNKK